MHPFSLFSYNKTEMAIAVKTEGGSDCIDSLRNNFYFDETTF